MAARTWQEVPLRSPLSTCLWLGPRQGVGARGVDPGLV